MSDNAIASKTDKSSPRFLWFVTLSYSMTIVLANWFDPHFINIFGLTTDAGIVIFPLTFLFSALITEVYGYRHARRAIWCGFVFNVLLIIYGLAIIHMPSPGYSKYNVSFDTLLATHIRLLLASSISYFCAEPLNSFVIAKLKMKTKSYGMNFRFLLATLVAASIGSITFSLIAFYRTINNPNLISLVLTIWLIIIACLPIFIYITKKLKQLEELDIYDMGTKFNIFSLEANYTTKDNEYSGP